MLGWISRLFKRPEMAHPVFGLIAYHAPGYWDGDQCHFPFSQANISISITAEESGPTSDQVEFFRNLSETYKGLQPKIAEFLRQECDIDVGETWKVLTLDCLQISNHLSRHPQHWQAGYSHRDNLHLITIEFHGEKPETVTVDG